MRRWIFLVLILSTLVVPVSALEIDAPPAPDGAQDLMPAETESFAEGLWEVIRKAVAQLQPELASAIRQCFTVMVAVFWVAILRRFADGRKNVVDFAATVGIGGILLENANSLIHLGAQTVTELSEYGKLLLPVMTAGLAAQGGVSSAAALYSGTVIFDTILSAAICKWLIPMIYVFLALAIAVAATGEENLQKMRAFVKWAMSWVLKILLYVFTGYMTITGVVSGTADASALKATKLTISGMVPVVGNILADASDAVLTSAAVLKSAAGVYGLIAFAAIWISPFLRLGVQYLLLKATAALCTSFGGKRVGNLVGDFSAAMGLLLAMTGTMCMLLLISCICMMKGLG